MISHLSKSGPKTITIDRERMLVLLTAGLDTRAYRFSRQSALAWLAAFPGDLEINLIYARALILEEKFSHAIPVLQKILRTDPECLEAALVLDSVAGHADSTTAQITSGIVRVLSGYVSSNEPVAFWAEKLTVVRQAINKSQYDTANGLLMEIIGEADKVELISLAHLLITESLGDHKTLLNLANLYHARWPECLQIALVLAKAWMNSGDEGAALDLLHYCAANDSTAQIPTRLWGQNFPYRPLYPTDFQIDLDIAIPAEVASKLGLNQLASGGSNRIIEEEQPAQKSEVRSYDGYRVIPTTDQSYPDHPKATTEIKRVKDPVVTEAEKKFKEIAHNLEQPAITHVDERFPAYVILSMKSGLEAQYGKQSAQVVLEELKKLSTTVQVKDGWTSIVFLPDDLEVCGKYNITPVDTIDPWKIKLALADLDKALEKTGERIGSVLIIGGDEVVPFHRLPNPTDDSDVEVPSDNPYGALDTNYFVSDWPVGRLPGETGDDVGLLLTQIRNAIQYHNDEKASQSLLNLIFRVIFFWNQPWIKHFGNIGYTASVWRRSSLAAFRPVGEGKNLYLSPNGKSPAFDVKKLVDAPIGYFNVHGVEDGNEWFGQKDPVENESGPDYPIALKPADLHRTSGTPQIVYCEACYGGHIFGKTEDESIALTLLGSGVRAMIASTTISYGSVTTPLIGADLVGYLVMKNLRDGLNIGSSLAKARVEFVREMNRRQGYLDGEDQKTLISFVLYGDPLAAYDPYAAMKKTMPRDLYHPVIKTINERSVEEVETAELAPKMIAQAKMLVKDYLPGIEYAEVKVRNQHYNQTGCTASHGQKSQYGQQSDRVLVSFSKQVTQSEKIHKQYAKVTLDKQGKMVKLAVSR